MDSVYKSVVTHSGGDSTIDYYYDARNRLWLRVLPAGHEEKRFYDLWDNVLTVASPLSANTAVLAYDDFVWLDGKLVATLRNGFTPSSPFSSGGLHFDETGDSDCGRVGATGACGLTHIVNDILPKPILAIHSNSGLISGVGMYDEFGAVNQVPVISGTNHPYTTMGPDGGVVGVGRLPGFAQADARVLYNYVDLPTGVSATVNNDAGVNGTHRGHVWSDWAPRDNYRATVRVGAPSGTTQGVQVDLVEFRSYATGAIPYFPTLRFPGQYADAETEKYINWNRFYDPSLGRYWQPESLLQSPAYVRRMAGAGRAVPSFAYALNNPINYVDPDGRSPESRLRLIKDFRFWVDFMTRHQMRRMPPLLNNFNASSPFRSEMGCGDQGNWMRRTLAEEGYDDYQITMAGGRTGAFGLWPHQWVVAISNVDNSVLALDPWTDTIQESPFFEGADAYDWLGNHPTALGGPWESIPTYGPWPSGDWW